MGAIDSGFLVAALQHIDGTIPAAERQPLWSEPPMWLPRPPQSARMSVSKPRQFLIQGLTLDGKTFRPSDWAERLAGAMSSFRPDGVRGGIGAFIGYSPYCVPRTNGEVKSVLVNEALRELEPMAWDFVMNFARDNQLQVQEVNPV
jgi:hypothetical protein